MFTFPSLTKPHRSSTLSFLSSASEILLMLNLVLLPGDWFFLWLESLEGVPLLPGAAPGYEVLVDYLQPIMLYLNE